MRSGVKGHRVYYGPRRRREGLNYSLRGRKDWLKIHCIWGMTWGELCKESRKIVRSDPFRVPRI